MSWCDQALPCGCTVNDGAVISLCRLHEGTLAGEYQDQLRERIAELKDRVERLVARIERARDVQRYESRQRNHVEYMEPDDGGDWMRASDVLEALEEKP